MTSLIYLHRYEPGSEPGAPPLLLLHGTGGDENDLIPLGQKLSPGSALLSPRGDVLEHGLPRFFRRFAEGVFDLADVTRRTHTLAHFIAAAAGRYGLDQSRLLAVGFSNGANIATSLLWLRPESLADAVLLRPMLVFEPEKLPDLSGKRILVSSGTQDPIVPGDHSPRLAQMLRQAGAAVTLHRHEAGHGLAPADFAAAKDFISRH